MRWAWYAPLLGGIVPVLLAGFLASALADRLAFAGWGLLVAAFYTAALRQGLQAGWPAARLAGVLLLVLGAGAAAFAALVRAHHEILDLGYRAVMPEGFYAGELVTSPGTAATAAGVLAAAGLGLLASGLVVGRRRRAGGELPGGGARDEVAAAGARGEVPGGGTGEIPGGGEDGLGGEARG